VNFYDNGNSLPLGEGMQLTTEFKAWNGAYASKGTDITKLPNQVITRK